MNNSKCICGILLRGDEKFCPECGSRVTVAAEQDNRSPGRTHFDNGGLVDSSSFGRNHHEIFRATRHLVGQRVTTSQIADAVRSHNPSFAMGSLLPNDHGGGNLGACRCAGTANRIFDRLGRGVFIVRGPEDPTVDALELDSPPDADVESTELYDFDSIVNQWLPKGISTSGFGPNSQFGQHARRDPLQLEDLKAGLVAFYKKVRSAEWPADLHFNMYATLDMTREQDPFTLKWWNHFILPRVKSWKAYRPVSTREITKWAIPEFDNMRRAYESAVVPNLETPFSELTWESIHALPDAVARAKQDPYGNAQRSPVFRSKVSHWIAPFMFPVADQELLGISGNYETYWKTVQWEWNSIDADAQKEMVALLSQVLLKFHSDLSVIRYPFEVKIVELCLIGRRAQGR